MKKILNSTIIPERLKDVNVQVTSDNAVTIELNNSKQNFQPCVIVKYKGYYKKFWIYLKQLILVEWSKDTTFNEITGSVESTDMRKTIININNLEHGQNFSFKIYAASIWAYGPYCLAEPKSIKISSRFLLKNKN